MSKTPHSLSIVVPGLDPVRGGEEEGAAPVPRLSRLAGRGSVAARRIDAGQDALHAAILDALQLHDAAGKFPSAAVIRTGITGEAASGFWLRAQPIHFAAGLDRLTTVPLRGAARMSAVEREMLSPLLADHLQSTGFQLHEGAAGEWLLRSEASLQVQTVTPEYAAANPHAEILPRGPDAGALRRLMTEMQMLLHEHPVNRRREARGLPVLNAIWIHGEGMLSDLTTGSLPAACGDDVYLRGIYRLHDQPVRHAPIDAPALLAQIMGPTVAIIEAPDVDALEAQWIAPLSRALLGGAIAKLTVQFEKWRVEAQRASMFRIWRRDLQPVQWSS